MPNTVFTTASGIHAAPLTEFCLLAILAHSRQLRRVLENQRARRWEKFPSTDVLGRTVVILGVGRIGTELARRCGAIGMKVVGIKRSVDGIEPAALHLDELHGIDALHQVLPRAEYLVNITPHTPQTEGLLGATELALLPRGAYLTNVGRGAALDEAALVAAVRSGHLAGAALDVFAEEPLPEQSPLWGMEEILVSPHTTSFTDRENHNITELFCENLRRYAAGRELRNVYRPGLGY
jgi:phosphoglycerate dehydrogenase-like enzyme